VIAALANAEDRLKHKDQEIACRTCDAAEWKAKYERLSKAVQAARTADSNAWNAKETRKQDKKRLLEDGDRAWKKVWLLTSGDEVEAKDEDDEL